MRYCLAGNTYLDLFTYAHFSSCLFFSYGKFLFVLGNFCSRHTNRAQHSSFSEQYVHQQNYDCSRSQVTVDHNRLYITVHTRTRPGSTVHCRVFVCVLTVLCGCIVITYKNPITRQPRVRSLRENLKLRPRRIDRAIARLIW